MAISVEAGTYEILF